MSNDTEKTPPPDPLHHLREPHKELTCKHGISIHKPCKKCADTYDNAFKIDSEDRAAEQEAMKDWT